MKNDFRDWFVMGLAALAWTAGTVFIFEWHSEANFATWAAFSATVGGIYHWLILRDSKTADAGGA